MNEVNGIDIVTATADDLPLIEPLLAELIGAVADKEGLDAGHAVDNCRDMIEDPAHHVLLAKDKDDVLGLVSLGTRRTILHASPSGLIDEMVVAERGQGRGIGRLLLEAAVDKCRAIGCGEIEVATEKSNTKARAFYRNCGFDEDAVLCEMEL